ncbi:MAG TPA: hypothetical protein EYP43_02965, partial [Thermoplasmata archaeon]|nr:hypothetical protein [Thermoplasmata archaeon]
MIRIVDEDEVRSLVSDRAALKRDEEELLNEIQELKRLLAQKDEELERATTSTGGRVSEAQYLSRIDILTKEAEIKDEEIVRLRERHERDVEIIARLHEDIDALKARNAELEARLADALSARAAPQAPLATQVQAAPPVAQRVTPEGVPEFLGCVEAFVEGTQHLAVPLEVQ